MRQPLLQALKKQRIDVSYTGRQLELISELIRSVRPKTNLSLARILLISAAPISSVLAQGLSPFWLETHPVMTCKAIVCMLIACKVDCVDSVVFEGGQSQPQTFEITTLL